VADEIRKRILDGRYEGGMQLRQDSLAEEFGVSRIPVREALVQLEAEGLLKIHVHKGAVVTEFSPESVEELFVFRSLLEPYLLDKSARRLSAADFVQLDAMLKEYSEEMRSMKVGRWGELNCEFHSLLYRHADSPRIEATVQQLLQNTDRFTRMQLFYTDGREQAEHDHAQIVLFCRERDYGAACEELRKHIVNAGRALVGMLRDRQRSLRLAPRSRGV
jgi:DNA-binding GntR family transcriptional regulator